MQRIINQNNKTMTTENNKLIAEFMGGYTPYERFGDSTEYYYRGHYVTLENMKFQTSWDWLMPVIEKIYKERGLDDEIVLMIRDSVAELNIESTYKFIVEFIKEHNN